MAKAGVGLKVTKKQNPLGAGFTSRPAMSAQFVA
jgi:hypothetical protein